jgi:tetratricopeptide (TPR) repeat protein/CHAT domain-containing protein
MLSGDDARRAEELQTRVSEMWQQGRYAEAEKPARAILALHARRQGTGHWQTADARFQLEALRQEAALPPRAQAELREAAALTEEAQRLGQAEPAQALPPLRRALDLWRRHLAEECPEVIAALQNLAVCQYAGEPGEAEELQRQALTLSRRVWGPDHPGTAASCQRLAGTLWGRGRLAEVEPLLREALTILRRATGTDSLATAGCGCDLGDILLAGDQCAEAEALYRHALKVYRREWGDEAPGTAITYRRLGESLHIQGRFVEAEPLYRRALKISIQVLEEKHPLTVMNYFGLADSLHAQGEYREAELLYRKALEISTELPDPGQKRTAYGYGALARTLFHQGNYGEAELIERKALDILRLADEQHLDCATGYNDLAQTLLVQGKHAEAETLLQKALAIKCNLLNEDDPSVAEIYNTLGCCLRAQGKYAEAEQILRRALVCLRRESAKSKGIAMVLNNLAMILFDLGRQAEAETLLREALPILIEIHGKDHPEVSMGYNNLAQTLRRQGKYAEAETLFRGALDIRRRAGQENHPEMAKIYDNLGETLHALGKFAEAEQIFRQALEIFRRALGEENPDTAISYTIVASTMHGQGEYKEAEALLRKALDIRRQVFGEEHLTTVGSYTQLGLNLYAQGRYGEAETVLVTAAKSFQAARLHISFSGLERSFSLAKQSPLPLVAAVLARHGKSSAAWQYLEADLARGLLDALAARLGRPLNADERSRQQELLGRLSEFDNKLAAIYSMKEVTEVGRAEARELTLQRDAAYAELSQLEAELASKYGLAAGQVYDLVHIQELLPHDAALVTWLDVGEHWACLVRHSGPPVWVRLSGSGPGGEWTIDDDQLPKQVRRACEDRPRDLSEEWPGISLNLDADQLPPDLKEALAARARGLSSEWKEVAGRLQQQRLAPLESHLRGATGSSPVRRLIVLPSASMAGVPVEMLTDQYTISYAPSGTVFAWLQERRKEVGSQGKGRKSYSLLALADPVFQRSQEESKKPNPPPTPGTSITVLAHGPWWSNQRAEEVLTWSESDPLLDKRLVHDFHHLPGTRREVEAIAQLFREAKKAGEESASADGRGLELTVLLSSEASRQRLAELAAAGRLRDYSFLHLATHAFPDDEYPLRSALILAKDYLPDPVAKNQTSGYAYNGQLTAAEILRGWELDAELVVLSACQTGIGRFSGGEGYLGFSQALFLAGARSLVLSLWKVHDASTALLMARFYENLLGSREGLDQALPKAEALQEAKNWLRNLSGPEVKHLMHLPGETRGIERERRPTGTPTSAHPFAHPYYWSAFTLLGDPD